MNRAVVVRDVIGIIMRYRPPESGPEEPAEHMRLEEEGLQSGEVVEVILDLEDRFGLEIEPREIPLSMTVGELADYVWARCTEGKALLSAPTYPPGGPSPRPA